MRIVPHKSCIYFFYTTISFDWVGDFYPANYKAFALMPASIQIMGLLNWNFFYFLKTNRSDQIISSTYPYSFYCQRSYLTVWSLATTDSHYKRCSTFPFKSKKPVLMKDLYSLTLIYACVIHVIYPYFFVVRLLETFFCRSKLTKIV